MTAKKEVPGENDNALDKDKQPAPAAKPAPAKTGFPWVPIEKADFKFPLKGKLYVQSNPVLLSDEKVGVTIGYAVKFITDFNPPHPLQKMKKGDIAYHSISAVLLSDVTAYAPIPAKYKSTK